MTALPTLPTPAALPTARPAAELPKPIYPGANGGPGSSPKVVAPVAEALAGLVAKATGAKRPMPRVAAIAMGVLALVGVGVKAATAGDDGPKGGPKPPVTVSEGGNTPTPGAGGGTSLADAIYTAAIAKGSSAAQAQCYSASDSEAVLSVLQGAALAADDADAVVGITVDCIGTDGLRYYLAQGLAPNFGTPDCLASVFDGSTDEQVESLFSLVLQFDEAGIQAAFEGVGC